VENGGGGGGSGGLNVQNPPPPQGSCPESMPDSGAPCGSPGQSCAYQQSDACGNTLSYEATCASGMTWDVVATSAAGCNPPPPPVDSCPLAEPSVGEYCNVIDSKICEYPTACCFSDFQCSNGAWQSTPALCNPPALICPDVPPADGAGCDPCAPQDPPCTWGCDDAAVSTSATCDGGVWHVSVTPCAGAGDGGGV
jgi:hypothetical protein